MALMEEQKPDNIESADQSALPFPPLTIDWDLFAEFLGSSDAPEDEKKETVETVFAIMVSFVDLGFGIEASQRAIQDGQFDPTTANLSFSDAVKNSVGQGGDNSKCAKLDNKKAKHKGDKV